MSNTNSTIIQFGAGRIYGVNTGAGAAPALIVPGQFATIQDASVDMTFTIKRLMGAYEFPEDTASASKTLTGKLTTGRVDLQLINQLVFADSYTTGGEFTYQETDTIGATPYQITVANSATWTKDLGVFYTLPNSFGNAVQLSPVASSPATGQYTVAAGVYTFAAADTTLGVVINYEATFTTGHSLTVNNLLMGQNRPIFKLYLSQPYDGTNDLIIYNCRASKMNIPEKREDYLILEIDFEAFAAPGNPVFKWSNAV